MTAGPGEMDVQMGWLASVDGLLDFVSETGLLEELTAGAELTQSLRSDRSDRSTAL